MQSTEPPALLLLFGLAGAGKSHVAKLLAARADYLVYEGDGDLPASMRAAIARKEPFTDAMRDELCTRLIARMKELTVTHPRVVVTQALYKKQHRQRMQQAFPAMKLIWVRASDDLIRDRLVARGDAVTPEYAAQMRRNFEAPGEGPEVLNEGSEHEIWEQIRRVLFPS